MKREPIPEQAINGLIDAFRVAARRYLRFPLILDTSPADADDDGAPGTTPTFTIFLPDEHPPIPRDALKEFRRLADDAVKLLRRAGIDTSTLPGVKPPNQWAGWLFYQMESVPAGEWEREPVGPANDAECYRLGDNAFQLSGVALNLLKSELWQELTRPPVDLSDLQGRDAKEAVAITLLVRLLAAGELLNVDWVARTVGVPRTTLYSWPTFKAALDNAKSMQRSPPSESTPSVHIAKRSRQRPRPGKRNRPSRFPAGPGEPPLRTPRRPPGEGVSPPRDVS